MPGARPAARWRYAEDKVTSSSRQVATSTASPMRGRRHHPFIIPDPHKQLTVDSMPGPPAVKNRRKPPRCFSLWHTYKGRLVRSHGKGDHEKPVYHLILVTSPILSGSEQAIADKGGRVRPYSPLSADGQSARKEGDRHASRAWENHNRSHREPSRASSPNVLTMGPEGCLSWRTSASPSCPSLAPSCSTARYRRHRHRNTSSPPPRTEAVRG
ncbi:hypothetical protein K438DRAFT_1973281 [Mycena galopus ATCC 62051]|nr:hypothetical protein K438DRAFT_1973281 [Mycena galopus ATCC 62051]